MERLDLSHHKIIVSILMLLIFITGVVFGVKLSGAMDTAGMLIIIFALCFLGIALLFIIFIQLVHLRDEMTKVERDERKLLKRR